MLIDRTHLFLLAVFVVAVSAPEARASHPDGGVTLYAGGGFGGASETFSGDVPTLSGTTIGNDHASSVRVSPGCVVTLYEHHDFQGRSTILDRDEPDLRRTGVGNDAVSSLEVRCRGGSVASDLDWRFGTLALYSGAGFEGRREFFYQDDANLSNNRIGNDAARSVRVAPGCRAFLYAGGNFSGRALEVTDDLRDLGATAVGNDHVSSVRVVCDRRASERGDDRRGSEPWGAGHDSDDRDSDDRRNDDRWGGSRDDRSGNWGSPWGDDTGDRDDDRWGDDRRDDDRRDVYADEPRGGATLFSETDYRGRTATFYGDVPDLSRTPVGNDATASVRVAAGCRLELFEHGGFRGRTTVVTRDVRSLSGTEVGVGRASSLRLDCRAGSGTGRSDRPDDNRAVTLYRDPDFRGESETFYGDVPDLRRTSVGGDAVSSVRVAPGCRVILYRHGDYRGEATVLTEDTPSLRYSTVGDNAASSIEVACR